jgi:16S rRNA (guanine1207-N2)-methyltransferase
MRAARLSLALSSGLFPLPPQGRIAVFRPRAEDDLTALPLDRTSVLTGFRPDHDHFAARGHATDAAGPFAAALVCLPRSRAHARALIAEAAAVTIQGGPVAVDGQKTDGIDPCLRDLRDLVPVSEALAKAHGKLAVFAAGPGLEAWVPEDRPVDDGFVTRPGVFSEDGPDPGSALLAAALPARLGPKVIDLGAGWGHLSRAILARDGVKRLDLVEAEAAALDCARRNVTDERARFHWADATRFRPEALAETVVMNPPFHTGRSADPALGRAFIAAARKMLAPDGVLWLVQNRTLAYDDALAAAFLQVEAVGGDTAFRLIRAAKPRRPDR